MRQLQLHPTLRLMRVHYPAPYLFFWAPSLWGLALGYPHVENVPLGILFAKALAFFVVAALLRSAGVVWNDVVDYKFDRENFRTRGRPIPIGEVTRRRAFQLAAFLGILAGIIALLVFHWKTIAFGLVAVLLALIYPYAKRIAHVPQVVMGFAASMGIFAGYAELTQGTDPRLLILFIGSTFWTMGYDAVYAFRDLEFDAAQGLKSVTMLISRAPKIYIGAFYGIFLIALLLTKLSMGATVMMPIYTALLAVMAFYEIRKTRLQEALSVRRFFNANAEMGLFIFAALLLS